MFGAGIGLCFCSCAPFRPAAAATPGQASCPGNTSQQQRFSSPAFPSPVIPWLDLLPFGSSFAQWIKGRRSWDPCALLHHGFRTSELLGAFPGRSAAAVGSWPNWGPREWGVRVWRRRKEKWEPVQLTYQLFSIDTSVFPEALREDDSTNEDEAGEAFFSVFYTLRGVLASGDRPHIPVWARVRPHWKEARQREGPLWWSDKSDDYF